MSLQLLRRRSDFVSITSTLAIVLVLFATPAFASPFKVHIPTPQRVRMLRHGVFTPRRHATTTPQHGGIRADSTWPAASTGSAVLSPGRLNLVSAGTTGLKLGLVRGHASRARSITVSLLPKSVSMAARVPGPIFKFSGSVTSATQVAVDYAPYRNLGGADWADRLQLVELPACAVTTPTVAKCQVETPLPSHNDGHGVITGTAPASTEVMPSTSGAKSPSHGYSRMATTANSGSTLVALSSGTSGSNGSFQATSLAPSGSWAQGGATGAFTYSYPINAPPPGTGADVAPKISLDYNSSSVDGQITTTNNQSSKVGEGWNYDPGYIERTYRNCNTDKTTGAMNTADLCWAGNIVTLHMPGGPTDSLVRDDSSGVWHPQNDNGERVTACTVASHPAPCFNSTVNTNGAYNGEYWIITSTDGTQYTFGRSELPGWATGNATANSAWTVPVYSPHTSDPCHAQSGAKCTMAWRWNLDLVQDTNHNAAAYYYTPETNYYGANNSATGVVYTRDGYLSHIDYGLNDASGSVYSSTVQDKVTFGVAERCISCSGLAFTTANASHWPDTPVDLNCTSGTTCNIHAPSFWTRKIYNSITSSYLVSGTTYQSVDGYALNAGFNSTGDPEMLLNSLVRTSYQAGGTTLTWPTVSFGYENMDNRVAGYTTFPAMQHNRLSSINLETGQGIAIHYEGQQGYSSGAQPLCTGTSVPSSPSTDTMECFPVYWIQSGSTPTLDYFHHYVVTEVDQNDANGTAPNRVTTYTYVGGAAWHYDDNEVVQPAYRTYGQARGYQAVITRTGNKNVDVTGLRTDGLTETSTTYFRGMDGDWLSSTSTRSVSITDSLGATHPDSNQFAGMPLEKTVYDGDGGSVLTKQITTYSTTGSPTATRARTNMLALSAYLVGQTASTAYTLTATKNTTSHGTQTSYDSSGRPITVTTTATGAPTSCVKTSYADNATNWVHDTISEQTIYNADCSTGTIMRDTRTFYDNSATLGSVTLGNATEVDRAKDANGSTLDFTRTTTGYDAYGRATTTTQYDPALASGNRTTTTAYTPSGTGPLTKTVVTNPKNQTTTTTFEPARGNKTKVVDVAGRTTTATYDAMGRLTAVWQPGQTQGTNNATQTYTYVFGPSAPLAVTSKTLVDPGNGAAIGYVTSTKIYDAFGNLRQTQTDGVGGGTAVTDTYPDSHGWVVLTDGPWYTSGSPSGTILTTAASGISDRKISTYDGDGRATQVDDYSGTTLTSTTKTIYGGDRTTRLPPAGGVASTSIVDGAGNQVELDQYKTTPTISGNVVSGGTYNKQTFTYDALGQEIARTTGATESSTALVKTWTFGYDLLGRRISVLGPDTGTTSTTYFDTGEIATTTDGASRVVAYDYDTLGRAIGKYANSTSGTQLAAWTYDTATNGLGKVASATSYAGGYSYTETANGYDANGNSTGTTLTSTDPALSILPSYKTSATWTSTHLQATETLASSAVSSGVGVFAESMKLWYDNHGDQNGLTGTNAYVSNATYSPFGELSQVVLDTNNETTSLTFTRDLQTRRITDINLSGQTATPQLEDMSYAYDLSGNITKITDVQGGPGSQTETQCFSYDGLDQLTQAWSALDSCASDPTIAGNNTEVGGPQPYWSTWKYDDAGNRQSQVQHAVAGGASSDIATTYAMGDPHHAHALTETTTTGGATGSTNYSYWPDGSIQASTVNGSQSTFAYGPDGQLASVQTSAGASKYVRDADGNILTRTDPTGATTLYLPGQEITISADKSTVTVNRYYSACGMVVATRVNSNNPLYLMSDLHGTNEVAVEPVTWGVTRRYLDPFGNALGAAFGGTWSGDHGFLGKSVNATTGLTDIGAREYDPTTGRFASVDPILTADDPRAANGYTYADNNPLTNSDPSGLMLPSSGDSGDGNPQWPGMPSGWQPPMKLPTRGSESSPKIPWIYEPLVPKPEGKPSYTYYYTEDIGPINKTGSPKFVMSEFQQAPQWIFPFPISGCGSFTDGAVCTLHAGPRFAGGVGQVLVSTAPSSFTFTVISKGYFDGPGSTISFSLTDSDNELYLHQKAIAYNTGLMAHMGVIAGYTSSVWEDQAHNLRQALGVSPTHPISWTSVNDWLDLAAGNWDHFD